MGLRKLCLNLNQLNNRNILSGTNNIHRVYATFSSDAKVNSNFGLVFDIDGVVKRGPNLLPHSKQAFRRLTNDNKKFIVPTIFVTNAGNSLRQDKASQLSEMLDIEVTPDQVVMSHSPLKMFPQFFDKHVLISGQGPIEAIAAGLGFQKATSIEELRRIHPLLDAVDHNRRRSSTFDKDTIFPRIEAILLFGEPVRWETNLQLLIDVLLTNGQPNSVSSIIPYPHIPILACNMDLLWMSDAIMPRFGHGCFLNCLESLYKKISGYELKYTALIGKPSEITYMHSEYVLQLYAQKLGLPGVRRMYFVGDNPDVDIYGCNLFNRYIQRRQEKLLGKPLPVVNIYRKRFSEEEFLALLDVDEECSRDLGEFVGLEECISVLVKTGVYSNSSDNPTRILNHNHRDFIMDSSLLVPHMEKAHVLDAVNAILEKES